MSDEARYANLAPAVDTAAVVQLTSVNIRDVRIDADIGVLPHEIGNPQPLLLSVALRVRPIMSDRLDETVDYNEVVLAARKLGSERTRLIESFAYRLAEFCLGFAVVEEADVLVEKPQALESGTAGARVVLRRAAAPLRAVQIGAG